MDLSILMWVVVIGTSFWVLIDASSIGVKKGQINGVADMGPVGWFFVCLLLWIVGFPFYLSKRGELIRINSDNKKASGSGGERIASVSSIDELEKLSQLRDKGALTEQEFQVQKAKVLGLQVPTQAQSAMPKYQPQSKSTTPPPSDNRAVNCPLCSKSILLRSVKVGDNVCPHCRQTFEAE